jgi:hypothetical protein
MQIASVFSKLGYIDLVPPIISISPQAPTRVREVIFYDPVSIARTEKLGQADPFSANRCRRI